MRRYLIGLAALAFLLRQIPLVTSGVWAGGFDVDEGVYLTASHQLLHGSWPYGDFLFVHPPGILPLLFPFALLMDVMPDAVALGLARVAMSAVAATCAVLVALLLRPHGTVAMVAGSLLYAAWSATVWSEWAVLLEPPLALALLVALLCLRRGTPRWTLVAGAVLGLALTVKLWAAVPLVVLAVMVLARAGLRRALQFAGAAAAVVVAVVVPFVVAAGPGAMWDAVVEFQAGRTADGSSPGGRIAYFAGSLIAPERLPDAVWLLLGLIALAAIAWGLLAAARARGASLRDWDPAWWFLLAVVQVAFILAAPSFYPHYTLTAAPALCLVIGVCCQRLAGVLRPHGRLRLAAAGAGAVLLAALAVAATQQVADHVEPASDWAVVDDLGLGGDACAWAPAPVVLIEADLAAEQTRRGCGLIVDPYATVQREVSVRDEQLTTATPTAREYQELVSEQSDGSELVILDDVTWERLDASNRRTVTGEFEREARVGPYDLWVRGAEVGSPAR